VFIFFLACVNHRVGIAGALVWVVTAWRESVLTSTIDFVPARGALAVRVQERPRLQNSKALHHAPLGSYCTARLGLTASVLSLMSQKQLRTEMLPVMWMKPPNTTIYSILTTGETPANTPASAGAVAVHGFLRCVFLCASCCGLSLNHPPFGGHENILFKKKDNAFPGAHDGLLSNGTGVLNSSRKTMRAPGRGGAVLRRRRLAPLQRSGSPGLQQLFVMGRYYHQQAY